MASNENFPSRTLTQFFNDYVTYELSKLSDKQVKMNKFYDYVVNYATKHPMAILDSQIKLDNTNIKSIYFNESRWDDLVFEIFNSNDLEIVINENHKINFLHMVNCERVNLKFNLEINKDSFAHKNNFLLKQCKFQAIEIKSPPEYHNQIEFNHQLNFFNCEIEKMDIKNLTFNNSLTFNGNTVFKESVNFDGKIFNANIKFKDCKFEKNISFNKAIFEKEIEFQYCIFNKADFSNTIFKDNAYFNNSVFNGKFMLYRAQFYKVADFFNLKFNDVYNFSSCAFKEPELVSFIGFKTNISIETLENYTERISIQKIEIKEYLQEKIIWIENLKNSFAVIKHNFLQRDNLIEANKHKVLEFYAEELRLKYECKIKERYWLRSLIAFPKITINYLQLLFYRHTSNHHTDLLKSFHTMLLLIAWYGIFNFSIVMISDFPTDNFIFNLPNILKSDKAFIVFSIQILRNLFIIIIFFLSFLGLLYLKYLNNIINQAIVFLSYVCTFLLLAIFPKSIISITNLFSGNQHILDPLSALSGIYTILFILLIYSLQKTSRRNSIM